MKKIICGILTILMIFSIIPFQLKVSKANDESKDPTRIINVVYDDSASTYYNSQNPNPDVWSNSLYAIEALSVFLEKKDTMNIFQMSSNEYKNKDPKWITIHGSKERKQRLQELDKIKIDYCDTPYQTVINAQEHLLKDENNKADELWLVIITDGVFQDNVSTNNPDLVKNLKNRLEKIESKNEKLNVVLLTVGNSVGQNLESNVYDYFHAKNSNDIVNEVAEIANLIFERRTVPLNMKNANSVTIDVPMKNLLVFAQGSVNNITSDVLKKTSGVAVDCNIDALDADYINNHGWKESDAYSGKPFLSESSVEALQMQASKLSGYIAAFEAKDSYQIDKGTYEFDMEGCRDFQVYYEPNLEVAYKIYDEAGNEVTNDNQLQKNHQYTYEIGFVNPDDPSKIIQSQLIDEDDLKAKMTIVSKDQVISTKNNQFKLSDSGDIVLKVEGKYFDFYDIEDVERKYEVVSKKLAITQQPQLETFDSEKLNDSKLVFDVSLDDKPLTKQEWNKLKVNSFQSEPQLKYDVQKDDLNMQIIVNLNQIENHENVRKDTKYAMQLVLELDDETLYETIQGTILIKDSRTIIQKLIDWFNKWKWVILIVTIFLYFMICIILKFIGPTGLGKKLVVEVFYKNPSDDEDVVRTTYQESKLIKKSILPIPCTLRRIINVNYPNKGAGIPPLKVKSNLDGTMSILLKESENKKIKMMLNRNCFKQDKAYFVGQKYTYSKEIVDSFGRSDLFEFIIRFTTKKQRKKDRIKKNKMRNRRND